MADLYMHHPRGSNNRLNEANAERNTADRMFDSQNNNRGGYNCGDKTQNAATQASTSPATIYTYTDLTTANQYSMVYYEGSILQVEWTNQHGCGGNALDDPAQQNCNIVIQYACDNTDPDPAIALTLRDGLDTNQINTDGTTASEGIHESVQYYQECSTRNRNGGLFTADQNLNGNTAIYTRQDPNGARSGLECSEERDYYPYWLPTPWIDIAYLTDRLDFCTSRPGVTDATCPTGTTIRCNADQSCQTALTACPPYYTFDNSENTALRYKCYSPTYTNTQLSKTSANTCSDAGGQWLSHTWNAPPMECRQAQWSRSNHLGNSRDTDTQMMNYNWTLPTLAQMASFVSPITKYDSLYVKCVLRMRYNISTDDYDMWNINSTSNGANSPVIGNANVDVGADLQSIQMSINTNQFGRTFQDRSHIFYIRSRPSGLAATTKVWNLGVRGKRGNIVQTYPAIEYDFVPNRLTVKGGADYVHLQWTGSNTHNNGGGGGDGQTGDAGEGTDGTDRHNFLQIKDLSENYPIPLDKFPNNFFANTFCYDLAMNPIGTNTLGQTNVDCAVTLATSGYFRAGTAVTGATGGTDNLSVTLDNAPPSLIGGVLLAPQTPGAYFYIDGRNNNFSNRAQKGQLVVA
jgi:hypothetical protein